MITTPQGFPRPARSTQYIGVIGPSEATTEECANAREIGRLLAAAAATLLCGGTSGVMEAACLGALENGGITVGLLPGTNRQDGNPYLTIAIPTGLGEMRNALLISSCDAVISVGGSWGTLSEVALARRTGVPLIQLWPWHITTADSLPAEPGLTVGTAADAVRAALDCARTHGPEVSAPPPTRMPPPPAPAPAPARD